MSYIVVAMFLMLVAIKKKKGFFMVERNSFDLFNICYSYLEISRASQIDYAVDLFWEKVAIVNEVFYSSLKVNSYLDLFLHRISIKLLGWKSQSFIWCIKISLVESDLLKWTRRTLKRIESLLVLFLKYDRKMPVLDEVHFVVNLYSSPCL